MILGYPVVTQWIKQHEQVAQAIDADYTTCVLTWVSPDLLQVSRNQNIQSSIPTRPYYTTCVLPWIQSELLQPSGARIYIPLSPLGLIRNVNNNEKRDHVIR